MISVRSGSIAEVESLLKQIPEFHDPYTIDVLESRLAESSLVLIAEEGGHLLGFKCGYPSSDAPETFYSWLGGVTENHRRKGVAIALLKEMESACSQRGFQWLTFKTLNQHKKMMIFALKNGFEIDQVVKSAKDTRKRIIFKKKL